MPFPAVASTNSSQQAANTTSHTVNLPAGIAAGNLLFIFFNVTGVTNVNTPTNWNSLINLPGTGPDGATPRTVVFYKVADGTEGSTVTITTSASKKSQHFTYRITDYSGTPEVSTGATGTTTSPDPDSLTPLGGSKDYLWIAVTAWVMDLGNMALSAYPTNYTDNQLSNKTGSTGDHNGMAVATRNNTASSENPGAFTLTGTAGGGFATTALTIAVSPVATPAAPAPALVSNTPDYSYRFKDRVTSY